MRDGSLTPCNRFNRHNPTQFSPHVVLLMGEFRPSRTRCDVGFTCGSLGIIVELLANTNWEPLLRAEWPWLIASALILATTLGFIAGNQATRWQDRRSERKARTGIKRLFETVLRSIDSTADVCALLNQHDGRTLSPSQVEHLQRRQNSLFGLLARITTRQNPGEAAALESMAADAPRKTEPLRVSWNRSTTHPVSDLPDRAAFDLNLAAVLDGGRRSGRTSHLLMIKIDRISSLVSRLGNAGVNSLTRKLAALVCRTLRDGDLVCHIGSDQLAVILPGTNHDAGDRLARAVRDAVRSHRFRVDQEGPEVLVTASFGLTVCLPEDSPDLVLDRAAHALAKSERLGRNQLHVHDGIGLILCLLSA